MMESPAITTDPVTVVISEIIQPDRTDEYEQWLVGINAAVKAYSGFIGVDIVRPRNPQHPEYVVIVRFDTRENLQQWQQSEDFKLWMDRSDDIVTRASESIPATGLEHWFTLSKNIHPLSKPPAFHKLVVLGILAVYPLVLFTNFILAPILNSVPYLFGVFVSVVAICILMTYPVLPWLEKILSGWLYPISDKKS